MLRARQGRLAAMREREGDFRVRGHEVTRLEGFSDAVFGFAVTLLVVSLEVPATFEQLYASLRGFAAFGACFAILFNLWNHHYVFCRRFGLHDGTVRVLTAFLLFLVVLYVYPLKFVFTLFVNGVLGFDRGSVGSKGIQIRVDEIPTLFTIYGLGFFLTMAAFALLYGHAYRLRDALELDPLERHVTVSEGFGFLLIGSIGLLSVIVANLLPVGSSGNSGYVYALIGPVAGFHGYWMGRRRRRLKASLSQAAGEAPADSQTDRETQTA